MNDGMQRLGKRTYSAMKLGWSCILISENLSEGLQENETIDINRQKPSLRVRI